MLQRNADIDLSAFFVYNKFIFPITNNYNFIIVIICKYNNAIKFARLYEKKL